jgi:hypothetical protein
MAKKKQFAGKKTKLARLPLTKALANQAEGKPSSVAPLTPPISPLKKLSLTWDEVSAGRGEPLISAFLFLVRELADLTGQLQTRPEGVNHRLYLPPQIPGRAGMAQALREARDSLQDLKSLLSHF